MFQTLEEIEAYINRIKPTNWVFTYSFEYGFEKGWWSASLIDSENQVQWSDFHLDPKLLFLNALGWLQVRDHRTTLPAWEPRDREVSLYRPPVRDVVPDPPDLDPDEVASLIRSTKSKE